MAGADVLEHRLSIIKGLCPKGIEVKAESAAWSVVQGVLSRGDSRLGAVLANMKRDSLSAWRRAFEESNLDPDFYVHREIPYAERLPCARVDSGVDQRYLRRELERARRGAYTSPCPKTECHKCGVC